MRCYALHAGHVCRSCMPVSVNLSADPWEAERWEQKTREASRGEADPELNITLPENNYTDEE
jgi:hypothetical protein